jgi:hypothetical protein
MIMRHSVIAGQLNNSAIQKIIGAAIVRAINNFLMDLAFLDLSSGVVTIHASPS